MPGLTGPQLTQKLREFDVRTPILFYSAAAFDYDKENARLAGAQGYLVKPSDSDHLTEAVRDSSQSHKFPSLSASPWPSIYLRFIDISRLDSVPYRTDHSLDRAYRTRS